MQLLFSIVWDTETEVLVVVSTPFSQFLCEKFRFEGRNSPDIKNAETSSEVSA